MIIVILRAGTDPRLLVALLVTRGRRYRRPHQVEVTTKAPPNSMKGACGLAAAVGRGCVTGAARFTKRGSTGGSNRLKISGRHA